MSQSFQDSGSQDADPQAPAIRPDLQADLQAALQQHFGFDQFRPGQHEVIQNLLAGRSAAAVFPTGSGKSLCFQLPALLLDGLTLVVSPLIALMKDQLDALNALGIAARRLDSTLTGDEYREVMDQLRSGELRMLYVAPERFNNERFRNLILNTRVSLLAIDEAHCISEWGHNFRPDYLKLAEFGRRCEAQRVLALTATATPAVQKDMCKAFTIHPECVTCTGFYRENLTLLSTPATAEARDGLLLERLQRRDKGPAIVYVTLQKTANRVADQLSAAGLPAKAYHAGMKDEHRTSVQDWFLASNDGIVVATIAFGMGIDKRDLRYVYHYNLPKSLENYSQEIGRAGRDQLPAICESLVCLEDLNVLENFVYGDTPSREDVHSLVEYLLTQGAEFDVSYYELAQKHDIRMLVIRTLLTYLELENILEAGTPFYTKFQFRPRMGSKQILDRFEGERRQFLAAIFRRGKKRATWFDLDVDAAAKDTGADRARVLTALDYLAEQEMIELKVQGVRNAYRRLREVDDLDGLTDELHGRLQKREQREIERVQEVVELFGLDNCRTRALCRYFGEELAEDCGHCTWCLNDHQPTEIPARPPAQLDQPLEELIQSLVAEFPDLFNRPHRVARMLCGITSPSLSKRRLGSDRRFGIAQHVAYPEVFAAAAAALQR